MRRNHPGSHAFSLALSALALAFAGCGNTGRALTFGDAAVPGDGRKGAEADASPRVEVDGATYPGDAGIAVDGGAASELPRCGDGRVDPLEDCDDGNLTDRDGCDRTCKTEPGFSCITRTTDMGAPCASGIGTCLTIPIVYRDFKPQNAAGGHPDFLFLGARTGDRVDTWCVPDASGPAKGFGSTARCWDLVAPELREGKPVLNGTRGDTLCACEFSDWSVGGNGGHVPGYTDDQSPLWDPARTPPGYRLDVTSRTSAGGPVWKGAVPIIKDAASFQQWFTDDPTVNTTYSSTLTLAQTQASGVYQFASATRLMEGGFYPLDELRPQEATFCNQFPYWIPWPDCRGDQYLFPPRVEQSDCPFQNPLSAGCWIAFAQGVKHNTWFTSEATIPFTYDADAGFSLEFFGDDDVFVFINGKLALDLGGTHQPLPGKVVVAGGRGLTQARIIEGGCLDSSGNIVGVVPGSMACDRSSGRSYGGATPEDFRWRTLDLGLEHGGQYQIAIFHADRNPVESNYRLTLSGLTRRMSVCRPTCGNGVVEVDTGEECDQGKDNTAPPYGAPGCTPACKKAHYCGDGIVDPEFGEHCDAGPERNPLAMACTDRCITYLP